MKNNRKRKSSSGPANSTGTGNTVGPSPNSPPSTHTPGDGMTTSSSLQHVNSVSKGFMYGTEAAGGIASSTNQLVRFIHAILKIMCLFLFNTLSEYVNWCHSL